MMDISIFNIYLFHLKRKFITKEVDFKNLDFRFHVNPMSKLPWTKMHAPISVFIQIEWFNLKKL